MQFLTYPHAGEHWLQSRLNRYAAAVTSSGPGQSLEISLVNDGLTLAPNAEAANRPTIRVIRNPLSVLASFCNTELCSAPLETPRKQFLEQSFNRWLNVKTPRNQELIKCRSGVDAMISAAMNGEARQQIHIRIEDFAAFPGATLRRICEFFEANCPIELIRSFVNADKPERRKSRFARSFDHSNDIVVPLAAAMQPTAATKFQEKLDLFSWVDDVPGALAQAVVLKYESFLAAYYPEVYSLFSGSESSRHAA